MNWFETAAHAAEAGAGGQSMGYGDLVLLGGFVLIFYFLLWRPQSKRRKEHVALMSAISKGDEVVTTSGLVGEITKVEDDFIKLKVAPDTEFRVQKSAVGATMPKGTLKSLDDK
ncbi:MAG: preprotein translocase subunit YajC [Pseudomonadales bacterium]|nr:preprotein translocase subunit YajC [Pseudomonadales bacterium]